MAAAYRFTGVTPNPAPWPKASVTLIPPSMNIQIELRQARRWNAGIGDEPIGLPFGPRMEMASAGRVAARCARG
jgi:hypothetical protein